jgi:hypothetical protein
MMMANRFRLATLIVALAASVPALTQQAEQASYPSAPHDLSGIWMNDNTLDETLRRLGLKRLAPGVTLPPTNLANPAGPEVLTPEYRAVYEQRRAAEAQLAEGVEACVLVGMPNLMTYPYPFEILHTEGRITLIFEVDSQVRRIFLNRSEHLPFDELDPTYNGDSIGHWEGDTLVVDTTGFHAHTELWNGLPHSDQLHIVERFAWLDADTLRVDMVLNDPLALTAPVERTVVYSKRPDWRIREYSCLENNRDSPDKAGKRSGGLAQ